jgi:hypothetical protein
MEEGNRIQGTDDRKQATGNIIILQALDMAVSGNTKIV